MEFNIGPNHLQHNFKLEIPTHFSDGRPVETIGLFLSGGLDSTILLCCILHELKTTNRFDIKVRCYTILKPDAVTFYSTRIINLINQHFNADKKIKIEHFNNVPNSEQAYNYGRIDNKIHDTMVQINPDILFYMGINRMVKPEIREFKNKLKINYKEPWRDNLVFPFLDLAKPQIVDLYKKLNVEFLIKYTHSCVSIINAKCNDCYSCEERKWAMDELQIDDLDFISDPILKDSKYLRSMILN